jgi:type IX secretion system PorP/SprF family membrane protein
MRLNVAIVLFLFLRGLDFFAQHPYFASPDQQLLSLNPAFAGSNKQLRVQTIGNRDEYAYSTSQHSTNYYMGADLLLGKRSGLGVSYHLSDYFSTLNQMQWSLSYAYQITIKNKWRIVPAFQASFFRYRLDLSKLNFGDPDNLGFVPYAELEKYPRYKYNADFSLGILIYQKNYFVGASLLSFTKPDQGTMGVSKRPITQIYQSGCRFDLNRKMNISIYGVLKAQLGSADLQLGSYFDCYGFRVHFGTDFLNDKIVGGLSYGWRGLRLGYNYHCSNIAFAATYFTNEAFFSLNFDNCRRKTQDEVQPPFTLYY